MLHVLTCTLSYMLVLTYSLCYKLHCYKCMFSVLHVTCYMLQVPDNIPPAAGLRGDNILLEERGLTFAPLTSRPEVGTVRRQ